MCIARGEQGTPGAVQLRTTVPQRVTSVLRLLRGALRWLLLGSPHGLVPIKGGPVRCACADRRSVAIALRCPDARLSNVSRSVNYRERRNRRVRRDA